MSTAEYLAKQVLAEKERTGHIGFFLCWSCGKTNPFGLDERQLLTWGVDRLTGVPFDPGVGK